MSIREWFSAQELTLLEGFPSSAQAVNAIARKDKWIARKRLGIQGRAREYYIGSLPKDIQSTINSLLSELSSDSPTSSAFVETIKKKLLKENEFKRNSINCGPKIAQLPEQTSITRSRTLRTPEPAYIDKATDSLEMWTGLFQQTTKFERNIIINFVSRRGLGYLISLIQNDLKDQATHNQDN